MLDKLQHHWNVGSRREFFTRAGSGLAAIALAAMLDQDGYGATAIDPLAPKKESPALKPALPNWVEAKERCTSAG